MQLLFDIGNRRCKCAESDGVSLHHHPPVTVDADGPGACLPQRVSGEVAAIAVASVRDETFNRRFAEASAARFGVHPVFAATGRSACGVTTAYRNAASLGVDRFLALIGAWRRCGGACVVADCGTAVTVDALNENGVHQGGLIMPGLHLLKDALGCGTDLLPDSYDNEETQATNLFARDTKAAIASGCRRMLVAAIGDTMREMQSQVSGSSGKAALFATGGEGALVTEACAAEYCPHLVIEGFAAFSAAKG